ncbi:hypothetical protein KW869_24830 [Pseudomonas urmiensis]|jgi:predicted negative regulator of RcsB-dependent stress response|uniref:Uncharacterized protein n=1 Tax=Pseudomonas urmiensis TaxID=2745493 RepID=A0ABW8P3D5_9PSED|nr:hypothetical protein [Pseudomonas sp.]
MDELLTRVERERCLFDALQEAGVGYATLGTRLREIDPNKIDRAMEKLQEQFTVEFKREPRTTIYTLVTALSAAASKPPGTSHR